MTAVARKAQQYASRIAPDMPQVCNMPISFIGGGLTPTNDEQPMNVKLKNTYKNKLAPQTAPSINPTDIIGKMCAFRPETGDSSTSVEQLANQLGIYGHKDPTPEQIAQYEADVKSGKIKQVYIAMATDEMMKHKEPEKPKVKVQTPETITAMIEDIM